LNQTPLVSEEFSVPNGLRTNSFVLEPLDVRHNVADHQAWTSSIDHIRSTPGFAGRDWPDQAMTLEDNAADLARHAEHFAERVGFTYTVLDSATSDVIGCVYLYPARTAPYDVDVRSWVRADRSELDKPLYDIVCQWLAERWPFAAPEYAVR
jgi:hypothetical protein